MDSTLNREQTDPQNVFARVHEEIARAYEQIAVADKQIARTLAQDAARHPPAAVNNVQVPVDRPSFGRPAVRGFVGVLLAACIGVAAIAWQSNGDAAKQMIARWAPQLDLNSSPAPESPVPAQPSPPAVQTAAAKATPPQPAPPAQTAPEPPGQAQLLLQSTRRDLAAAEQDIEQLRAGIEQLKTSQEQMVRDNAAVAEQLKASQEQMARLIAKASEQNLRPKTSVPRPQPIAMPTRKPAPKPSSPQETSAPPPRPIATPTRKPVPKPSSPQARAQPLAPMQGWPEQQ